MYFVRLSKVPFMLLLVTNIRLSSLIVDLQAIDFATCWQQRKSLGLAAEDFVKPQPGHWKKNQLSQCSAARLPALAAAWTKLEV